MLNYWKSERYFLIPFIAVWIIAFVFFLVMGKVDTHLALNNYHTTSLDLFFRYFTEIGGWVPFAIAGILLLFKWRISVLILVSQLIATLIISPIKHSVRAPRPSSVFNELGIDFPIVEGISLHSTLSFPSGHTAAVFALCTTLSIFLPKWWQKILCLIFALLGGYSRIYLSQHFLEDVLIGSIIGTISTYIAYKVLKNIKIKNTQLFTNNK